jgi:leucyl-tRNA synthetase
VLLLSPIVPHFCEELWASLGHDQSVLLSPWPTYDDAATVKDEVEVVVQVNGKLRSRFSAFPLDTNDASAQAERPWPMNGSSGLSKARRSGR